MDHLSPLVLEISSDEEAGLGDARKGNYTGGGDMEDHNWLSELLGEVDRNKDYDSDEVVLVSEMFSNPKRSKLQSLNPSAEVVNSGGDDDDDDCVVLDCDPDRLRVVENRRADNDDGGDGDSDDLEIVGEKGEVACRDFPHPRHLCAKFVFVSTPHEVHCVQCHCYVCDSLAPCAHWGTGISSIDHCHANDKEEYWIAERKSLKRGTCDVSFSAGLPQPTQVPALLPPLPNSLLRNGLTPVTNHPCSMSFNAGVQNVTSQGRSHSSRRFVPRSRHQTQIVPQRSTTTCHSNINSLVNNRRPQYRSPSFHHPPAFKKPELPGASQDNRHGHNERYYRSQISRGSSLKRCPRVQTPVLNSYHGLNQQNIGCHAASPVFPQPNLSVPQSMNAGSENSQSQRHSQPHLSCLGGDPIPCQPQMPSQPYVSNNFRNAIPFQSPQASHPNLGNLEDVVLQPDTVFQPNCPIPSQAHTPKQSDAGKAYENHMHSRSLISSHEKMSNAFENQSSQPRAYSNPTSLFVAGQNDFQQRSQDLSYADTSLTDFGLNWDPLFLNHDDVQISPDISRSQSVAPSEHFQYPSPTDNFQPGGVPASDNLSFIDDTDYHFPGNTNSCLLNLQFVFENQSSPGSLDNNHLPPGLSVFSPRPASMDIGTFFDS